MKVIKRDGTTVSYDRSKIKRAIQKANAEVEASEKVTDETIDYIISCIESKNRSRMLVEDIQDIIEQKLMDEKKFVLAKTYIIYRYSRELVRKANTTDESILSLIQNRNKDVMEENSNKNATVASTQRDLIAGEVSKDLTKRILLPEKISKAHEEGILHFHDADYFLQPIFNCCLINIGDMLDNGTVMNGKMIESPKSFQVACTITTQIIAAVASNQYGGQSVDISHLGKYVRKSYDKFKMGKEERELAKEIEKLGENSAAKSDGKESKKADIVVELRNIEDRIIRLTPTSSNLGYATIDKEGNKLYYECSYESGMNLWELDLKRGTPVKIGPASGNLVWDKNMSTLFVLGSKFMKMKPGSKNLERISVNTEMILDKAAEREYMFDRVYRQEKARFYNTGMHGVDWEMYRDEYQKFLPHINNNYDFAEMLSELLGELNVSHTGSTHSPQAKSNDDATANLGLFFDLTWKNDGLKVDEIIEQGPFDKASSKLTKGDIITKINGIEILKGMDYYPLLNNKAGERTLITYKKPDGSIIEEVVKPVSNGTVNTLLYKRWIKWCAEEVERLSGGRLGYVHIEGMNDASFRNVYSDILGRYNHCDGIVIDTRFNGGGRLHEDIEILFSGKKYLTQEVRGKDACDMPSRRYNKPSIMIIGEANYSNAHGTPWVYKHKGMGKLVGKPVPGTMTTVSWETMQDPTLRFGIPIVGYRQADGTYLENSQLNPDIDVENTKELVIKGRDEQLEAAVKALLEEIDAAK